jgi:hypothetical protein
MGFTPTQAGEMSLWQFNVTWGAFVASKTGDDKPAQLSPDDIAAASEMIDSGAQWTT